MPQVLALTTSASPRRKRKKLTSTQEAEYNRLVEIQRQREVERNPFLEERRIRNEQRVSRGVPRKKKRKKRAVKKDLPSRTLKARYNEYMQSDSWAQKRKQYLADDSLPQGCQGCGSPGPGLHLHHHTYERLGHERLDDLVPVCAECHGRIHDNFNMFLFDLSDRTERVLEAIRRSVMMDKPYRDPTYKIPAKNEHAGR